MEFSRCRLFTVIIVLVFALLIVWKQWFETRTNSVRSIERKYFGEKSVSTSEQEDVEIKQFRIPYDPEQIADLKIRLRETRLNDKLITINERDVTQTTYGFPRHVAESIRKYWIDHYDWKVTVDEMNKFDHFKTLIDGLNIHFVRFQRIPNDVEVKKAILFLHGWPSSFLEFLTVAESINASSTSHYDFIIPSLPGFGYSDASVRPGLTPVRIGVLMNVLMERLGYSSYIICGSDWGSFIGTYMAHLYPSRVVGLLTTMVEPGMSLKNMLRVALAHFTSPWFLLDEDEQIFLNETFDALKTFKFFWNEGGYFHLQSTKPDTIGYGLNDSPIGLATYILEKWSRWSNSQDDIDRSQSIGLDRFNLDQLISTVMLYWTTGTITSSMRIYFEDIKSVFSDEDLPLFDDSIPMSIPVAVVNYRHEISYTPRILAKDKYPNIRLWLYHSEGGHFSAMERIFVYARDLERFVLSL